MPSAPQWACFLSFRVLTDVPLAHHFLHCSKAMNARRGQQDTPRSAWGKGVYLRGLHKKFCIIFLSCIVYAMVPKFLGGVGLVVSFMPRYRLINNY